MQRQKGFCQGADAYFRAAFEYKSRHGGQNQKNTQNCRRNDTENMAKTEVTPRRGERSLSSWALRQNRRRQRTKRTYPYKIKLTLPKQKSADITKDGNVIKTIRV